MKALLEKSQFIGLEDCTWLYSGAETPVHRNSLKAITDYMHHRGHGPKGRDKNAETEWQCKQNLARLMNGMPEDIALMSNSSEVISMIARSLNLKSGDNVIINTLEFPSGIVPWLALKEQGVEVRVVQHKSWQVEIEDILDQVDEKTRLVMTSHVSYLTGARIDYRKLYSEIKKTGALLLLDVTQSLGVLPIHMYESDFTVCSSYKWLLSIHGAGILAINPERTANLVPAYVGWRSTDNKFTPDRFEVFEWLKDARRFELGFPSYPTIYTLNYSTGLLLETGIEPIERHVLTLGGILIDELLKLGFEVMTPEDPKRRAGNICVTDHRAEAITQMLLEENVYVWGGDGRFRASIHLFNDLDDIQRLVSLLTHYLISNLEKGGRA